MSEPTRDENAEEIEAAIFVGHKIQAIKAYRERTGKGLKESKDFVEALEDRLRSVSPEKFTAPPRGKGCGPVMIMLFLVVVIVALLGALMAS